MENQTLWQIILADLELQVSKAVFQTFLSQTKLLKIEGNRAIIGCGQPMLINLIEKRYYEIIKKTLDSYTKNNYDLEFTFSPIPTKKNIDGENGPLFDKIKFTKEALKNRQVKLNPEYTFENFAVSSSNQMAHAAASAVSKNPATFYNPLFLYGGVGVGKTHLMQAIGHVILNNKADTKIIYCTGEEFTNDIIEAIVTKTTVAFKKKYRKVDVLLIDDIQFIAGKNAVQEEFFHTFNAIEQEGGQIVLTSDKPPDEINKLEARLCSRFEGGLTIDIGQPDFELRTAILLIKAKQKKINLPIEAAKLISANVENPRKLEGVLIRIYSESTTRELPIDIDLVKNVIGKIIKETPKKISVKPDDVIAAVASHYNIKPANLKSDKRDRNFAHPRQILYFILKSELNIPLMEIGNLLGGRDHTTILHGVRKISHLLTNDKSINEDIIGIRNKLFG